MDSFIYSINATVPIFLVMIIGWFIKQIGLIDDHFANVANRYVFKVALPALLFRDLSKSDFKGKFDPQFVLYCSIVTILMFSLVWIATEILMKDDTQKGAFVQGSCRSSAAILGMAFVQNMYSDTGMAPLMIVAAVPLFNIFAVVVLTFKAHPADSSEAVKAGRGNNIKKAFVNILKNPIKFIDILCSTTFIRGGTYTSQLIGSNLGLLTIKLNNFVIVLYLLLILVSPFLEKHNYALNFKERLLFVIIAVGIFLLILTGLYLSWTLVGKDIIDGVQGRYFIPIAILPLLCLVIRRKNIEIKNVSIYVASFAFLFNLYAISKIIIFFS